MQEGEKLDDSLTTWFSANGAIAGATITAMVAFAIFFLTRAAEIVLIWVNKKATRKRLVIGLFQEVKYNLIQLERFHGGAPDSQTVRAKVLSDSNFRPLVVRAETAQFYDAIMVSLPEIDAKCLIALSRFYEKLRRQERIADAFESLAFMTISPDGRAHLVDSLWEATRHAEGDGWKVLYEFELAYPRSWFSAFK
jgi:hypothetical protein